MVSHVPELMNVMIALEPYFSKPVWKHVVVLVTGALLSVGDRTVAAALRATGHSHDSRFEKYHRVLSRDAWSGMSVARVFAQAVIDALVPSGTLVFGCDDTIERRWGAKIAARGIYRDPVRSSHGHFVKVSGLRWLSVMLLTPVPWAKRILGLPILTALSPSKRYYQNKGREHKKLTEVAKQAMYTVRRWFPNRNIVVVGDSSFAVLEFLSAMVKQRISVITRLRLDAVLHQRAPEHKKGTPGRPCKKGKRLPALTQVLKSPHTHWRTIMVRNWYGEPWRSVEVATGTALWYSKGIAVPIRWVLIRDPEGKFEPQALLSTELKYHPKLIIGWFVRRWSMEGTFREVRDHLGVETQRQWSESAIARTTPSLMGLFSLVVLTTQQWANTGQATSSSQAAWYQKRFPTFSDALAQVRIRLWHSMNFSMSPANSDIVKISRDLFNQMTQTLAYAA